MALLHGYPLRNRGGEGDGCDLSEHRPEETIPYHRYWRGRTMSAAGLEDLWFLREMPPPLQRPHLMAAHALAPSSEGHEAAGSARPWVRPGRVDGGPCAQSLPHSRTASTAKPSGHRFSRGVKGALVESGARGVWAQGLGMPGDGVACVPIRRAIPPRFLMRPPWVPRSAPRIVPAPQRGGTQRKEVHS